MVRSRDRKDIGPSSRSAGRASPASPGGEPLVNPIDAFIRARLEAEHLAPSPEADRSTLIRRLSLDLRGLPPRPDEVEAFRRDTAPGAYERLVDRMLASPAYGERWGRHWLDQARYADSNGFTIDSPRSIWKYRDWVISAINDDLPFDQFAIEQLAGDLLPKHTPEEVVATGFHRNTLVNEEGGVDKEQFRIEAVMDRVNTTGAVFLGLTVGCAQCHHHKFDPISQRDYYNLFAIFNNCDEPTFAVASADQARRLKQLERQIAAAEKPLAAHDRTLTASQPAWEQQIAAKPAVAWKVLHPAAVRTEKGTLLNPIGDDSLVVDFSVPANDTYHIEADVPDGEITAIRLEALTHMSLPLTGPGSSDAAGNFVLSEFELRARPLKSSGPAIGSAPGVRSSWRLPSRTTRKRAIRPPMPSTATARPAGRSGPKPAIPTSIASSSSFHKNRFAIRAARGSKSSCGTSFRNQISSSDACG